MAFCLLTRFWSRRGSRVKICGGLRRGNGGGGGGGGRPPKIKSRAYALIAIKIGLLKDGRGGGRPPKMKSRAYALIAIKIGLLKDFCWGGATQEGGLSPHKPLTAWSEVVWIYILDRRSRLTLFWEYCNRCRCITTFEPYSEKCLNTRTGSRGGGVHPPPPRGILLVSLNISTWTCLFEDPTPPPPFNNSRIRPWFRYITQGRIQDFSKGGSILGIQAKKGTPWIRPWVYL